ncbi:Serine/threonine protein phosphatase 2A regulatory subunit B''alpha [Gracilariopsis chorda]|uniref:Serine/threonine protein phosphatase 2A regulatory subunit B''alpha n=1 Tax=Gracilariopsis chorda TaxID=448386 RepID=A0A2V3J0Y7_9FLOR|nr:Serine/threonine protein phosphatase 2A regulatory subunit B''alpha [Gracilariopsis chorda]|eukprot:PXF47040.1 Serine/threonine protein phosphatase 2A regulatory subunit B''alpha [Gracilariopsis chorda]
MCHQGLAFLHATPEFQQRYSETVIERIYFGCTRQHNGRLTLQDVKRSRLLRTLLVVDEEEDINRERQFFSYEHFYVLYCRFWELDSNHDLQIDREDLMRYGSHSLTSRIVERIFGGYARPLDSPENPGFMSYTDFIWFCLSEEDKTSDTAIDYWFRCVDRDGDGLITMYDMEFFYKEQLHRMECFGHEPVQIKDILCQLLDMIKPNVKPPVIRRKDLKRCRLAGNFFNVLFNLNKFFAIEARDPLQIRQEHATPELTDWDRFAALEYLRLSAEEEEGEEESWEEVGDAANPLMAGEAPF